MLIREISSEDNIDSRILDAMHEISVRTGKELIFVLIEPENWEDLVVRPDIPQFSKNIVDQTRIPVIKISSSNDLASTQTFWHIKAIDGMYIGDFYDGKKPVVYTMTSGPIVASTSTEEWEKIVVTNTTATTST